MSTVLIPVCCAIMGIMEYIISTLNKEWAKKNDNLKTQINTLEQYVQLLEARMTEMETTLAKSLNPLDKKHGIVLSKVDELDQGMCSITSTVLREDSICRLNLLFEQVETNSQVMHQILTRLDKLNSSKQTEYDGSNEHIQFKTDYELGNKTYSNMMENEVQWDETWDVSSLGSASLDLVCIVCGTENDNCSCNDSFTENTDDIDELVMYSPPHKYTDTMNTSFELEYSFDEDEPEELK